MSVKCNKCSGKLKKQVDSPFLTSYVCKSCGAAFHEVKDDRYPYKAMNPRKVRRYA